MKDTPRVKDSVPDEVDPSEVADAVAKAADETEAVEILSEQLDADDRETIIPATKRWDDTDIENLIESVDAWEDEADLVAGVAAWDEPEPEADQSEFITFDPEAVHPTRVEVIRDVKAYFAEEVPGSFERHPDEEFLETNFFDFSYLEGRIEIERYWVREPFAFVTVLYDPEEREYEYRVVEPLLDEFEKYVRQDLVTLLRNSLLYQDLTQIDHDREKVFAERSHQLIEEHAATVDIGSIVKVYYYLTRDFLRYGPIDAMMQDPAIEDISCDGAGIPIYIYNRTYRNLRSNVVLEEQRLNSFAVQLAQRAGKQLSVSEPLVDASLPDGSRIQITLGGDISTRGSNFTIRKFADIPFTPVDLIRWNTFSAEEMAYFWLAIENNKSLIFAGGTGSGKTTSMNAVSFFIPPGSKLVTIEDTREIDLPHENWIQSVSRRGIGEEARGEISMYDLLQSALRQRPEYLIVGEIRTEQRVALTFFQAMSTGHTAYTTVHADSIDTALSRLQNPPLSVPTQMLQELDIISIQRQSYIDDRRVRRNRIVTELEEDPEDPTQITATDVFEWNPDSDTHERVGDSHVLTEIAHERGWSEDELEQQFEDRKRVLEYLVENDFAGFDAVASTIHMFAKDPTYVLEQIEADELTPDQFDVDVSRGPVTTLEQRDQLLAATDQEPEISIPPDERTLADLADELQEIETEENRSEREDTR